MPTPTDPAVRPLPHRTTARIGPPLDLHAVTGTAADRGYGPPLEVARHVWRMERTAALDPLADAQVGRVEAWLIVAAHLTPAGWWCHVIVAGSHTLDALVLRELADVVYPGPSWRLDPVGAHLHNPDDGPWADMGSELPAVRAVWGPLEHVSDLATSSMVTL